jgi:protein SCO1/2
MKTLWRGGLLALLAFVWLAADARAAPGGSDPVGLDDQRGARLPLDAVLRDETGAALRLGELADRPLLVTFVYLACSRRCPLVLGGLAEALARLPLRPGEDYAVVTISIDERDTPAAAAAARRNYLAATGTPFPPTAWRFLTGDAAAVRQVTDAVGLRYQRHGDHFFHPETLIVVAPGGVVTDYLPVEADRNDVRARIGFQPAQLQQALADARGGRVAAPRPPQVLYCFPFEREPERSFFRMLTGFGILNLVGVAAVLAYQLLARPRAAGKKDG